MTQQGSEGQQPTDHPPERTVQPCPLKRWIRVALFDARGEPAEGEPFLLTKQGQEPREGRIGADGWATLEDVPPGEWQLQFTQREFDRWHRVDEPLVPSTLLAIRLQDAQGEPAHGEPFRVEGPQGELFEGKLDQRGRAEVDVEQPGLCKVSFPQRDGADWWPRPRDD